MKGVRHILKSGIPPDSVRDLFIFLVIFAVSLFLSFSYNIVGGKVKHPGKIWSDAAHYYVYLPATFIYQWDVYRFPYQIEKKFYGFTLNSKTSKVEIKTTCGEAILLLPFFLTAHASAGIFHIPMDGFSSFYQMFMLVGCVFYFVLGLFFLKKFLDRYFNRGISLLTVLLITLTTQIYFYVFDAVLMSHTYSFFLFCAYFYFLKLYLDGGRRSYTLFTMVSLSLALAVLIRPTNIMIILWMAFLDLKSVRELWQRILFFLHPKRSLIYILIQLLVLVPQFMYWKYLSGHYIYYSYPGEVFFWSHPMILQVFFSPFNGLFPYHPVFLLLIAGAFYMVARKKPNGIFTLFFFFFAIYVFSCWHCWYYGGSFGFRPMAEFTVFLALPLGYLLGSFSGLKNLFIRSSIVLLFVMFIYYNLMQFYHYNVFSGGMWSWDDFFIKLKTYQLVDYPQNTYEWKTDFANNYGYEPVLPAWPHPRSPYISTYCNKEIRENVHYRRKLDEVLDHPVHQVRLSAWIYPGDAPLTHALWICRIEKNGASLFEKVLSIDEQVNKQGEYAEIRSVIDIPEWIDRKSVIHFYFSNPAGREFYIDDVSIKFQ